MNIDKLAFSQKTVTNCTLWDAISIQMLSSTWKFPLGKDTISNMKQPTIALLLLAFTILSISKSIFTTNKQFIFNERSKMLRIEMISWKNSQNIDIWGYVYCSNWLKHTIICQNDSDISSKMIKLGKIILITVKNSRNRNYWHRCLSPPPPWHFQIKWERNKQKMLQQCTWMIVFLFHFFWWTLHNNSQHERFCECDRNK